MIDMLKCDWDIGNILRNVKWPITFKCIHCQHEFRFSIADGLGLHASEKNRENGIEMKCVGCTVLYRFRIALNDSDRVRKLVLKVEQFGIHGRNEA